MAEAFDLVKQARDIKLLHSPGELPAGAVRSGRVTKTNKRNQKRIAGTAKPKKKATGALNTSDILCASDAGWLRPSMTVEESKASKLLQTSTLTAVTKVVYMLYHKIDCNDIKALLHSCGMKDTASAEFVTAAKHLSGIQSKYQGAVMNDYEYPKVAFLITHMERKTGRQCPIPTS